MKRILSILLVVIIAILGTACKAKELKSNMSYAVEEETPFKFAFNAFDTQCSITIYSDLDDNWLKTYADDMRGVITKVENLLSKTKEGSDVYAINHRDTNSVMIADITADIFELGSEFYNWTGGKFDISSGTLIGLWDVKNRKTLPTKDEINEAKKHCGNFRYTIERDVALGEDKPHRITFEGDTLTQYDLGALAKGYMCDVLKEQLALNEDIKACIVNLGGNVLCTGKLENRKGGAFNIGIFKPFSTTSEIVDSVKVVDKNVITSGIYQRYFKVEGDDTIYHHIIDPQTGYPCQTGLNSVTIISENGLLGDYMSTACMLIGAKDSTSFIDNCSKSFGDKNIQAIFCDTNNNVTKYPKNVKHY